MQIENTKDQVDGQPPLGEKKPKKPRTFLAISLVLFPIILIWFLPPEIQKFFKPPVKSSPGPREAIVVYAENILGRLARLQFRYSASKGGEGERNFCPDPAELLGINIQEKVIGNEDQLYRAFRSSTAHKPLEQGWVFDLLPHSSNDNFQTNFQIRATPAPGFVGPTLSIDKSEKLIRNNAN